MPAHQDRPRVAIFYHHIALYRHAVFAALSAEEAVEYTIFADICCPNPDLKLVDPIVAEQQEAPGWLRWTRIKNWWFYKYMLWQSATVRIALTGDFDAIIFLGDPYHFSTWVAAFICRLRRTKVFMWTHGFLTDEKDLKGFLRMSFYRLADAMLVYGPRAKAILEKKGYPKDRVYVIFNSLDHDAQQQALAGIGSNSFEDFRREMFGEGNFHLAVYVGRVQARKKIDMLLKAIKLVSDAGQAWRVLVVGDGEGLDELRALARDLSLESKVVFHGASYCEKELVLLIGAADVLVSPGHVGLSSVHALTYGTPVITHDNLDKHSPEVEAIIPGRNGAMFEEDSIESLAACMQSWVKEAGSRSDVRAACQETIARSWTPIRQVALINEAVLTNLER